MLRAKIIGKELFKHKSPGNKRNMELIFRVLFFVEDIFEGLEEIPRSGYTP
jgi:hypothetical protein